ncbi:hypothetical protein G6F43_007682 [Rhizopus delemar]|nr:hypothetical protein G6F43_007682 [Rhizopus delemar]
MPPIERLDEAFLSQLLCDDQHQSVLNTQVDTATLTQVLGHLDNTFASLQTELYQYVQEHHDLFSSSHQTLKRLEQASDALATSATEGTLTASEAQQTTESTLAQYRQASEASRRVSSKIEALERIMRIVKTLKENETKWQPSHFLEAIDALQAIESVPHASVAGLIETRLTEARQRITIRLQEALQSAVRFEPGSIQIVRTGLDEILSSMDRLGRLTEEMVSLKRQAFKTLIQPFFEQGAVERERVGEREGLRLKEGEREPVSMMKGIEAMLHFFFDALFDGQKSQKTVLFGHLVLPDLMHLMLSRSIAPAVPSSRDQLSEFGRVQRAVRSFEAACAQDGFELTENPLSDFVDHIDRHYAKKRRERVLKEARTVMLRRLYDAEPIQIETDSGQVQTYHISQSPQLLAVLISDTLAEAAELKTEHPISAAQLTEGVHDLLDMYRAIMPSHHRPQLLSHPSSALIFRNDCFWLAHQLQTTSRRYGVDLKEGERLEELGKAWQELCMMQRVDKIQTILDTLQSFSAPQTSWEPVLSTVLDLVRSFADDIRPRVDPAVFFDILGRIVDSVLNRLMGDLEDLTDIGADESHEIARSLNSLIQLVSVFDHQQPASPDLVGRLVPNWLKFWLLKDILEMNMREIMEAFRRGSLHMFQKSELEHLLCALFADSDLRRMNLEEIRSGQPPVRLSDPVSTRIPTTIPTATPTATPTAASGKTLLYHPEEDEETTGWDEDEVDLDLNKEGWDEDDLDLMPVHESIRDEQKRDQQNDTLNLPPVKEKTDADESFPKPARQEDKKDERLPKEKNDPVRFSLEPEEVEEGWDNDELDLSIAEVHESGEGWDDEDLFGDEK